MIGEVGMNMINKNDYRRNSFETVEETFNIVAEQPVLNLQELDEHQTALVLVDMPYGFAREGALRSTLLAEINPAICELSKTCDELGIVKLVFTNLHPGKSSEFDACLDYCMGGTNGYTLISRSSTNGFHEEEFKKWLKENLQINNFIVIGDSIDICIQQFAITLKTWFNKHKKKAGVIVPIHAVGTYDLGRNIDLMDIMALYNMMINGIQVVKAIE